MSPILKKIAYKTVTGFLRNQTKRLFRKHPNIIIVGVTGSVGKTSTKRAIAAVLKQKYRVLADPASYNTETGLPLSLFELQSPGSVMQPMAWLKIWWAIEKRLRQPYPYDVAVLEMGADQLGEIGYFMKFIKPEIGVVTAVAPAHMEGFKSLENILLEKFKLALGSRRALINADDQRLMSRVQELNNYRTFGLEKGDYSFSVDKFDLASGFKGTLVAPDFQVKSEVKVIAKHSLYMATAAAGVGDMLGLTKEQIKAGLADIRPAPGRMNLLRGQKGSVILDDSYNSNPVAVTAALDTLYALSGRKIAVLGNMNEMGDFSKKFHREMGEYAAKVDLLLTVAGDANKYLAESAIKSGLSEGRVKRFDSPYAAGRWLATQLKAGDKILVKGSQNKVFSEEVVAEILEDPADKSELVRQYPFWQKIKRAQFDDA